ncbi:hypothetical protein BO85DRAFT_504010 [Aspergillus piperis CBS 112811]|uniref:Uncharacterized protein n=1 Tax=Aspergillus piperis CBS 112811 TaxID=1448313 RepID=A0A8G1QT54_9EURO|nr:hypothetical protein BO85DRAFT_504010 [Aspergillus piperis CBS 112811]RAH53816.1 hypothetical protein BO85DRAFT_504010 [Aspergillus piperis CBS 112811]
MLVWQRLVLDVAVFLIGAATNWARHWSKMRNVALPSWAPAFLQMVAALTRSVQR